MGKYYDDFTRALLDFVAIVVYFHLFSVQLVQSGATNKLSYGLASQIGPMAAKSSGQPLLRGGGSPLSRHLFHH